MEYNQRTPRQNYRTCWSLPLSSFVSQVAEKDNLKKKKKEYNGTTDNKTDTKGLKDF